MLSLIKQRRQVGVDCCYHGYFGCVVSEWHVHCSHDVHDVPNMADTPLPLPATDNRDVGVAIGCGNLYGLTTSFEVGGVL